MNIIRYRRWFFLLSALMVVPSLGAFFVSPILRPGIDFTGGTAITVEFEAPPPAAAVRELLVAEGHTGAIVQATGENAFFIRLGELRPEVVNANGDVIDAGGRAELEEGLGRLGIARITGFDSVSGIVGAENVRNAILAVVVASIAILFYVTWAFRRVPNPFRYGTTAIIALTHDVVLVLGVFSYLGKFADVEVNAMFIVGVLTIIGYSVNDTIVVFDRIRENVGRYAGATLTEVVNLSIRETIGRSLNTSLTLLMVVIALLIFGGPTIQGLLLVLLVGVIVGTYSSIFTASLLLIAWEQGELGGFFRKLRLAPRRAS